ncbi:MAG: formimidoylglutamase, partial [Deltaproteobacteria bacterium]|nr:formimidoylglutamase [Deltaproteobacteria bacterium]
EPFADDKKKGVVLLGVASDEGVKRNQGRAGAAAGPAVIRQALCNQAFHLSRPLYDAGNLHCETGQLEALQQEQADVVLNLLKQGHFPLLLGGGHEIAFGSYLGLERYLAHQGTQGEIGIINFDAHFDLRHEAAATSGTPFLQIAAHSQAKNLLFHYLCLGINEVANTEALFVQAGHLGAQYIEDDQLNSWQLSAAEQTLKEFIEPCQAVYLSIDLDVLPAATAPGVSAPGSRGLPLPVLERLLSIVRTEAAERLRIADIAEYNPTYDIDLRTAKVAARLCHLLTR